MDTNNPKQEALDAAYKAALDLRTRCITLGNTLWGNLEIRLYDNYLEVSSGGCIKYEYRDLNPDTLITSLKEVESKLVTLQVIRGGAYRYFDVYLLATYTPGSCNANIQSVDQGFRVFRPLRINRLKIPRK